MDDKLLTDKTVLEWLTLEGCEPLNGAMTSPVSGDSWHAFPCGLWVPEHMAGKNPLEAAAKEIRLMHERHHRYGHAPLHGQWGFVVNGCVEHGFTADCLDCDPVPELGLEYDRNEMEANGVLPPW